MPASFIQIPIALLKFVRESKLTSLQQNLWLYFYEKDPFGDRSVPIPSIAQISAEFGVCTRTIQTAIARLSDLGLMKFSFCYLSVQNTTTNKSSGSKKVRKKEVGKNFHKDDPNCTNEKKISQPGKNFPKDRPGCSSSKKEDRSQTVPDFKQTFSNESERQENKTNKPETDLTVDYWLEDEADCPTLVETENLKERSNCAEVEFIVKEETEEQSQATSNSSKPWLVQDKFDANFVEWLAKKWSSKYGDTLHTARSNVLRHFKKDEGNVAIAWSEYSAEYLDRFKNTQTRLANGLAIKEQEQKRLIENQAALSRPLPAKMSLVSAFPQPESIKAGETIKQLSPVVDDSNWGIKKQYTSKGNTPLNPTQLHSNLPDQKDKQTTNNNKTSTIDWHQLPEAEKPDNPGAYQNWQPEQIEKLADLSQIQNFLKSIS